MKTFITKVLHKILSATNKLTIRAEGDKRALVSYVKFPFEPFNFKFFFDISHNRYLCSYVMCKVLKQLGYTVDLYDYQDTNINYNVDYALFIGHNINFSLIANKLPSSCKKIILTTGSSPMYDNQVLAKRELAVQQLKNTDDSFYEPIKNTEWAKKNFSAADYAFMIGNDTIRQTWPPIPKENVYFYNNLTNVTFQKKFNRTNNFLYLSSTGQLRRGLDIILEIFKDRKEKIYICGPYKEAAFLKHFSHELTSCPNIILKGFVDQTSADFASIIDDCTFGILPSVSEGQSGSVLTFISHGLLPVITPETGFVDIDKYGFSINRVDIPTITEVVSEAVKTSDSELAVKRENLYVEGSQFTTVHFQQTFTNFIKDITK
ncbi:glycosyltransferase [Mucilaginibacter ginkgonis]|uniref:Glycosyltransferase involved in cell wall biosynthesis n=1 Tax=Mucilaginibacter ginkgonis TaxID=2682091 RepID=A0A6I4I1X5_9SPHI|nr:hypothetical protein [Mucilaginibacter ginkgonis]QQL50853.1 hypothetical protein GO620_005180 [Mucilaginibacter ginkgonis]